MALIENAALTALAGALNGIAAIMAQGNRGEELRLQRRSERQAAEFLLIKELRAAGKSLEAAGLLIELQQTAAARATQDEEEAKFFAGWFKSWRSAGERLMNLILPGTTEGANG